MSSPIANNKRSFLKQGLIFIHQQSAHSSRVDRLASIFAKSIQTIFPSPKKTLSILDVGCGDMTLAETISRILPHTRWTCTDIHPLPTELSTSEKWSKYRQFDGEQLPFESGLFDAVVFSDVLHHCLPKAESLLREAGRVGEYVMVKDHFETGPISRQILRMMDFVGNYGYGVSVPTRYFDQTFFASLAEKSGLDIVDLQKRIPMYPLPLSILLPDELQFLSILKRTG